MDFTCDGNGEDHCCYQAGKVCPYLRDDTPGRRWACGLFVKYGSWDAMNRSAEYQSIGRHWMKGGNPFNYCETYLPRPGTCCQVGK